MTDVTLFVGLDVHKKTISVALVDAAASATVRFYGTIVNTPDALLGLSKKLSKDGQALHFCYEAGPCGYGVQRQLTRLGHRCDVVAPALIPRKVGDKVKTDRRDAMMLAQTLRAGQLTAVWVPDEAHEAMRDLVRLRAQAMRDLRKTRQQLLSFLLRHGLVSPYGHWTKMHRRWLGELVFAHPAQHLAHEEMLQRIERAEALCDRLKGAILDLMPQWCRCAPSNASGRRTACSRIASAPSNGPMIRLSPRRSNGLYMQPPAHAVVLSIDEKSQIQALDRTQPGPSSLVIFSSTVTGE